MSVTKDTASSIYLWSDVSSERLNMPGKGLHERTLLWISLFPGDSSVPLHLAWSVSSYETDAAGNVPTASIIRPYFDGASLMERMPMDYGVVPFIPNGQGGSFGLGDAGFQRDIRAKRKLDDTSAILLVLEWTPMYGTPTLPQHITVAARSYISW